MRIARSAESHSAGGYGGAPWRVKPGDRRPAVRRGTGSREEGRLERLSLESRTVSSRTAEVRSPSDSRRSRGSRSRRARRRRLGSERGAPQAPPATDPRPRGARLWPGRGAGGSEAEESGTFVGVVPIIDVPHARKIPFSGGARAGRSRHVRPRRPRAHPSGCAGRLRSARRRSSRRSVRPSGTPRPRSSRPFPEARR